MLFLRGARWDDEEMLDIRGARNISNMRPGKTSAAEAQRRPARMFDRRKRRHTHDFDGLASRTREQHQRAILCHHITAARPLLH